MIEIAVVGLGSIARKAHLPLLATNPAVRIVGLASRTGAAVAELAAQYRLPLRARTLGEILAQPPRAAFVLSSTDTHAEVVCALLEAGVDVYMEKPLAPDLAAAEQIAATAARTQRTLMVGFNRRYAPLYVRAKELVAQPSVIQITKHRHGGRFGLLQMLLDDAIHIIDLARFYGGDPTAVNATVREEPNSLTALLRFPGGVAGVIAQTYGAGQSTERVELHGGGVSARVEEMETLRIHQGGTEQVSGFSPWTITLEKRGFAHAHAHFLECLQTGARPQTDAADALRTQQLAMALMGAGR